MKKKALSHLFAEKSPGQLGLLWVYYDQQKPLYYERKKKHKQNQTKHIYPAFSTSTFDNPQEVPQHLNFICSQNFR